MSISSGSDVTIPIQDSPPPPPSPYANAKDHFDAEAGASRVHGIDNKSFSEGPSSLNELNVNKKSMKNQTEIPMDHYAESGGSDCSPKVTEAVNTELVHGVNVLDTIPHKPQSEFGPYEKFPEYFISVNQHKKFFARGEKLSVTKDKRRNSRNCKKYLCWGLGGLLVAALITVAVLAAVGLIPEKSADATLSQRVMTTSTGNPDDLSTFSSTETDLGSSSYPPLVTPELTERSTEPSTNYVPNAADVELRFKDAEFEDDLDDATSSKFKSLAAEVESEVKQKLEAEEIIDVASAHVTEFRSGSIIAKLRIGWSRIGVGEEAPAFQTIQTLVSSWTEVGNFTLGRGTVLYPLYNSCKLSNGGCSHNCAFDESSLEFMCTCPEDKLLDSDKKTCVEPQTHVPEDIESSSASSSEPPFEVSTSTTTTAAPIPVSATSVPEEVTTVSTTTTEASTTTTTELPPVTPQEESNQSLSEDSQLQSTSKPEVVVSSHSTEDVTTSTTAHPEIHPESTSEPAPVEPTTSVVTHNETSEPHPVEPPTATEHTSTTLEPPPTHSEPDENVAAVVVQTEPEVITITFASDSADLVTTPLTLDLGEPLAHDNPTVTNTTSESVHQAVPEERPTSVQTVPEDHQVSAEPVPQDRQTSDETVPEDQPASVETIPENGQTSDDTVPEHQQVSVEPVPQDRHTSNETQPEMGPEVTTLPILEEGHAVVAEVPDEDAAQNSTGRKSSRAFDSSETSEMEPTREPLLHRPSVTNSDEFMVYSDIEMAQPNNESTTLGSSLASDEIGTSMSQEEMSHEMIQSGEQNRPDQEPHRFEQLIIPRHEIEIVPVTDREREEMTTQLPMSYINDTLVNEMTENVTEDVDSEQLTPRAQSASQESSAEGVVIEANASKEQSNTTSPAEVVPTESPVDVSQELPNSTERDDDLATLVQEVHSEIATAVPSETELGTSSPQSESEVPREESSAETILETDQASSGIGTNSNLPSELSENELTS